MSKVALVTGAGTGIGRAAAVAMLKAGYRVALVGRRREPLEQTAKGFEKTTLVFPGDITQPAVVKELFSKVRATWGRLDVLPSPPPAEPEREPGDRRLPDPRLTRQPGPLRDPIARPGRIDGRELRPKGGHEVAVGARHATAPAPNGSARVESGRGRIMPTWRRPPAGAAARVR